MHQLDQWIEGIINHALKPENYNSILTQSLSQNVPATPQDLIQILCLSAEVKLSKQSINQAPKPFKYPDLVEKIETEANQILASTIDTLFTHYTKYTRNNIPGKSLFPKYLECIETLDPCTNRGKITSKMVFTLKDRQTKFVRPFSSVKLSDLRRITMLAPAIGKLKLPTEKHELYPCYFEPTLFHSIDNLTDQIALFVKQLKASYIEWCKSIRALEISERKHVILNTAILLVRDINQVKAQQTKQLDEISDTFNDHLKSSETETLNCIPTISPVTRKIDDLAAYFERRVQNLYLDESRHQ